MGRMKEIDTIINQIIWLVQEQTLGVQEGTLEYQRNLGILKMELIDACTEGWRNGA